MAASCKPVCGLEIVLGRCNLRRVDGIVGGPPCPPWSTIGGRAGSEDPRSGPFNRFLDILEDQGQKGCLFFIMEMVPGQDHQRKGEGQSDHSKWLLELRQRAPMWQVQKWLLNSSNFGVPHNRLRLYTVGVNTNFVTKVPMPPVPAKQIANVEEQWRHILHPGLEVNRERYLTTQQRLNLILAKHIGSNHQPGPMFLVISMDRNPRQAFGAYQHSDGLTMALRSANEMVWLLKTDANGHTILSRPLHPFERFGAQGFPAHMGELLTKKQIILVTGNAMTVPVIGGVLASVLTALIGVPSLCTPQLWLTEEHSEFSSTAPGEPSIEEESALQEARKLWKRKMAHQIAIMDGARLEYRKLARMD